MSSGLIRYVRQLDELNYDAEIRREIIESSSRPDLERLLARGQIKKAAECTIMAVCAAFLGTAAFAPYFMTRSNNYEIDISTGLGTAVGLWILPGAAAVAKNIYLSTRTYANSLR